MKITDWVQEVLSTFEQKTEAHSELQIVDALDRARKAYGDLSDEDFKGYVAERSAFFFRRHPDKDSVWSTFFGPMATLTTNAVTETRVPDIKELDNEVVVHWEGRAQSANDPVMRARYADVVWDLKRAITNERASHEFAQIATDAYLQATQKRFYTTEIEAVHWLKRALSLALSIRDMERTKQVVTCIFEFYDQVAEPQKTRVLIFPFDALYGRKDLLSAEQEAKIISDLEAMLARTSSVKDRPEDFDPHGAQAAAERLAQHYKRQNDKANVERVIKAYGGAFERISKEAAPMLAMAWLQPVIERYEQEGLKQDAERLQLMHADKGKNIASDLKEVSATVEIKKEEIDKEIERLIGSGDLTTALLNVTRCFIPKVDHARKFLEQMRTEAPLLSIFQVGIIEKDGHTSATIGSLDDDPDGRLHRQLGQTIGFYQPFLALTLERLRTQYKLSVDDILKFLYESPLFVDSGKSLLREGLEAYEKEDFVKAMHVLVPQIEHILRNFLGMLGVPTLKTVRNHPGIMDAKSMNDILSDERMRDMLSENLWRYLTVLYIEKKGGLNLRNDLAHGLLPPDAFNRQIADRVFHSLLALSLIREQQPKNVPQNPGPSKTKDDPMGGADHG
ncbi:MAG: hypothetical protein DMG96_33480 [Acidobacteria bacterium]|nr:MAG: hypothetical protein DMG96_33480 [Acidobacteriota bacterium]